jgi:hypothetical protein
VGLLYFCFKIVKTERMWYTEPYDGLRLRRTDIRAKTHRAARRDDIRMRRWGKEG